MASFKMPTSQFFSFVFFFFFMFLSSQGSFAFMSGVVPKRPCIKTIYSLGDSIADTGNLLLGGNLPEAFSTIDRYPYGMTRFAKPTGRCSDGYLIIDFLAKALNLSLVTPYLQKDGDFKQGVNFAIAGATALDKSFFEERGILLPFTNTSLGVQFQQFKTFLNSTFSSPADRVKKLEGALVLLGEIGGNDYNYAFLARKSNDEVISYVPHVVETIINATKEVISLGVAQVVVPGNFPIGCMPIYLTTQPSTDSNQYDENKCLRRLNGFAIFHNTKLEEALAGLRKEYPHVHIKYADYYHAYMVLIKRASILGFDESTLLKACCGTGGDYNFDVGKMCGTNGASVCDDPATHISWDGVHLTEKAYSVMARLLFTKFSYPHYNFQEKWRCS